MASISLLLVALPLAKAQQIYIPAEGPTARPQCTATNASTPVYSHTSFSYTLSETVRYATSVPAPTASTTYASSPASLTTLVPSLSYTTWGNWNPNGTSTANDTSDPYGEAAWTALWVTANPPNFTETSLFSTTVSPTAIPTSELVLPPRDYFGPSDCYNFPEGFALGVASSASQIEGATAQEGKSPSLMDILVQDDRPKDYVTNENYYYYKQDIERVAAMGVKYFSFSIAWTRILPFALPGTPVNQAGIDHYNDVINFILEKGMVPEVTLLHFDTPLQFYGDNQSTAADPPEIGYVNGAYQNESFPDAFVNYAKVAMTHFADRVPVWYTFNEPLLYSYNGISIDHVIKSHARVYHFYKEELNGTGKIAMKFNNNFGVPRDPSSDADVYAANHFNSFQLGPFLNPTALGIDYPDSYKQTISDYVPLNETDLAYLNGTIDFIGVDPYTATVVAPPTPGSINSILDCASNSSNTFRPYCVNQTTVNIYGWDIGYRSHSYVYITPTYLRSYLNYLYNTWYHPIVITEFGFPVYSEATKDLPDQLFDTPRSLYYLSFMSECSSRSGKTFGDYDAHFGVQTVNRTTQERRYKKSFFDFVDFMKARGVE
ncbi:Beta-glucosidase 4 [Cyphellophora attinorum]|uniref:Beta-glucosidase 4 n=1 Tax=Cyphellophora attinorum TaxID=1664694 RepID=A0A0N1P2L9_9EURO|nr:Beta-glucosidase 4 [Phialophora attinorum]KPI42607.1 Beta-glucosidase 4 [Phialophora attinorum]